LDNTSQYPAELERLFRLAATDPVIAHTLSRPVRVAALRHLINKRGKETGEAELSETLDLSLSAMRYHLTVLQDAGLVTCVKTRATYCYIAAPAAA